jgi:hypothetical protein
MRAHPLSVSEDMVWGTDFSRFRPKSPAFERKRTFSVNA